MFAMVAFQGPLNVERAEVEDELETAFLGIGEVTGAGVGQTGSHLDLDVDEAVPADDIRLRIIAVLTALQVSIRAKIVVGSQVFMFQPPESMPGGRPPGTTP